jgi:hypothetical protein
MAKINFDIEYDFNFILLAISSHEADYKLCFAINQALGIEMLREDDIQLKNKKQEENLLFSLYSFLNEEEFLEYNLISNKSHNASRTLSKGDKRQIDLFNETEPEANSQKGYLLDELSNSDFLFIIKTDYNPDLVEEIENKIKQISFVLNVQILDVQDLPSKKNLII